MKQGREHPPETVWQAQDMYCIDRLSFDAIARASGVAASTLKRWAEKYGWRQKREAIAQAEADIRHDKIMARSKTIKALMDKPDPNLAFAVSSLESLTLKEAEAAVKAEQRAAVKAAQGQPSITIETVDDAIAALKSAVNHKISALLTRPEMVDLKSIKEMKACLALLGEMEAARPGEPDEAARGGLGQDMFDRLMAAVSGDLAL